jgi:hypothetical protein
MGLVLDLIALPVTGPVKGLMWIAQQLVDRAEHELYDSGDIRGKLLELELRYDMGEIGEDEYNASEQELLERLKASREREIAAQE